MATSPLLLKNRNRAPPPTQPQPMLPPGSFLYEVYPKTYTPEEISELGLESEMSTNPTRNVIVKTIPRGTLLYTYFEPAYIVEQENKTKHHDITKYLNTFACTNIEYSNEEGVYKYCISNTEPGLKYFYGVPFLGNGVLHKGERFKNVVVCVAKEDLRVVYGKSGTLVEDSTFAHKDRVAEDPKRVIQCSELEGGCRPGKEDDRCITPEFARSYAIDGLEHMAYNDVLFHYDIEDNTFRPISLESKRLFKNFIDKIYQEETQIKELEAKAPQLESMKEESQRLTEEVEELESRREEFEEEKNKLEDDLDAFLKTKGYYYTPAEWRAEENRLGRELPDNAIKPITNAANQEVYNRLKHQIKTLEGKIFPWEKTNYIRNLKYSIHELETISQKKESLAYKKNLLNMLLLQLDIDHHANISMYGFSEQVLNTNGWRAYTEHVFLPQEDPLYTQVEKTATKQVLTIREENLEAFLHAYVYPRNYLAPIALVTTTYAGPPPRCTVDAFPSLEKGGLYTSEREHYSNSYTLYNKCMNYLLKEYKIGDKPPRLVYDMRTNLFQIFQYSYPNIPANIPFFEGSDYAAEFSRYKQPTRSMFQKDITVYNSTTNDASLSSELILKATQLKALYMIMSVYVNNSNIYNLYRFPTLNTELLFGPFTPKVYHPRLYSTIKNIQQIQGFMTNLLEFLGDSYETPVTDLRQYMIDDNLGSLIGSELQFIGRYSLPITPSNTPSNTPTETLNARASALNLYSILGVNRNANAATIQKAYKKLALTQHPDKGGNAETFKTIGLAYTTLSNPTLRKAYNGQRPSATPAALANRGGYRHRRTQKKRGLKKRRKTRARR